MIIKSLLFILFYFNFVYCLKTIDESVELAIFTCGRAASVSMDYFEISLGVKLSVFETLLIDSNTLRVLMFEDLNITTPGRFIAVNSNYTRLQDLTFSIVPTHQAKTIDFKSFLYRYDEFTTLIDLKTKENLEILFLSDKHNVDDDQSVGSLSIQMKKQDISMKVPLCWRRRTSSKVENKAVAMCVRPAFFGKTLSETIVQQWLNYYVLMQKVRFITLFVRNREDQEMLQLLFDDLVPRTREDSFGVLQFSIVLARVSTTFKQAHHTLEDCADQVLLYNKCLLRAASFDHTWLALFDYDEFFFGTQLSSSTSSSTNLANYIVDATLNPSETTNRTTIVEFLKNVDALKVSSIYIEMYQVCFKRLRLCRVFLLIRHPAHHHHHHHSSVI
jgi:hypothetical protein